MASGWALVAAPILLIAQMLQRAPFERIHTALKQVLLGGGTAPDDAHPVDVDRCEQVHPKPWPITVASLERTRAPERRWVPIDALRRIRVVALLARGC